MSFWRSIGSGMASIGEGMVTIFQVMGEIIASPFSISIDISERDTTRTVRTPVYTRYHRPSSNSRYIAEEIPEELKLIDDHVKTIFGDMDRVFADMDRVFADMDQLLDEDDARLRRSKSRF